MMTLITVAEMSNIYHGCFRKNTNGKNCLMPTTRAFWKYIENIPAGLKTRSQYKKQKLVDRRTFDTYF